MGSVVSRGARVALVGFAAAYLVEAIVLRRRAHAIQPLAAPPAEPHRSSAGPARVLSRWGADVDEQTVVAAAHDMHETGAESVDLVPGDLPADRALRLLRRVDPQRLGDDPLYAPAGGHEAVALRPDLAERMGHGDQLADRLDMAELVRATRKVQRHAPMSSVLRVAPSLHAGPLSPGDRWHEMEELAAPSLPHWRLTSVRFGIDLAPLLGMIAGLAVAPGPAALALAAWSAQPVLVFGAAGGLGRHRPALQPPNLARASAGRLVDAWRDTVVTAIAGFREAQARAAQRRDAAVPEPPPPDELFEPRRDTCPWCGSDLLVGRVDVGDNYQYKPGRFHLDECAACGHIFQNPALSLAGLDYYYDQFYDGIGEALWESVFAGMATLYNGRVDAVAQFTEPRSWLDVGTGHGHFCLMARRRWPEATFDGLDVSDSVLEAKRRGWIDSAHRGLFPELADGLPRTYDVVSMHHYLEHTRDPRAELGAAAKALDPGGYLMIEVPDPSSPWSRRLGPYWNSWFQPQHQHFVPCPNLVAELGRQGFDVVSIERGSTGSSADFVMAVSLAIASALRSPHVPWRPRPGRAHRLARAALMAAAAPAMAAAAVADAANTAYLHRQGLRKPGNAYRVVARRA
jgi:SAM-dependent methyltransferase